VEARWTEDGRIAVAGLAAPVAIERPGRHTLMLSFGQRPSRASGWSRRALKRPPPAARSSPAAHRSRVALTQPPAAAEARPLAPARPPPGPERQAAAAARRRLEPPGGLRTAAAALLPCRLVCARAHPPQRRSIAVFIQRPWAAQP